MNVPTSSNVLAPSLLVLIALWVAFGPVVRAGLARIFRRDWRRAGS